jgi:hypothetical protein
MGGTELTSKYQDTSHIVTVYLVPGQLYGITLSDLSGASYYGGTFYADPYSYSKTFPLVYQTLQMPPYQTITPYFTLTRTATDVTFQYTDSAGQTSSVTLYLYQNGTLAATQTWSWPTTITYDWAYATPSSNYYAQVLWNHQVLGNNSAYRPAFWSGTTLIGNWTGVPASFLGLSSVFPTLTWPSVFTVSFLIITAASFAVVSSGTGALVIALLGAFFWYVGLLPGTWMTIISAIIIAVFQKLREGDRYQ